MSFKRYVIDQVQGITLVIPAFGRPSWVNHLRSGIQDQPGQHDEPPPAVKMQKLIPFDPAMPLLGRYPKDYKSFYSKDTCTRMFIAALFTIAKTWNQPKCPLIIDWIGNNVAHIHHGILCSNQK